MMKAFRLSPLRVTAAGIAALVFVLPFVPGLPKEELVRTSAWGLAVLFAFAGWGSVVARASGSDDASFSLRAVWGASLLLFVGGLLACAKLLWIGILYGAVGGGCLLLALDLLRGQLDIDQVARVSLEEARRSPALVCLIVFVAAGVALRYFGGASDTTSNPYDDDVAYYPAAKQLLEQGTLIDPFSFRRLSALGGQTFFHALLLLRVSVVHLNVLDRGVSFLLAAALLATHRIGGRRVPGIARLTSVATLVMLPCTSINAASYYSGLAFFLGLFQTLERLPEPLVADARQAAKQALPLAITGAAVCTLRQNYQVTAAVLVGLAYVFALVRTRRAAPFRKNLVEPLAAFGLTVLFVLPWLVLLYRSSGTFLFPIMKGTYRTGVEMRSQAGDFGSHVRLVLDVWLQPDPLRTLPLFFFAGLALSEERTRAPIASMLLASFAGIVVLAWSFDLSDAENLTRYAYGFTTAAAFHVWHTVAVRAKDEQAPSFRAKVSAVIAIFALLYPLHAQADASRKMLEMHWLDVAELLRRSAPMQRESPATAPYHRLQDAVPSGARMLVMLDRPYYLDYHRNEIWNLDMPGSASPAPGIPCFQGSAPVADYLRAQGIRYVAFVESDRSTYLYRRAIWVDHLWDRFEIWRTYAPYMVDVMDNLADLARKHRHLHDEAGMVLLDLEAAR